MEDPKCPWCGKELDYNGEEKGVTLYACHHCDQIFYEDDNGDIDVYEPMSDDDYELAKFCRGDD